MHRAMARALASAGLSAGDVDWIAAHGTGTVANDAAESAAIATLLAEGGHACPPVSSTKGVHGHALGASGLLEAAVTLAAMRCSVVLPTHNLRQLDPDLRIAATTAPVTKRLSRVLKTTLGFGGINAAVVLGKA
jgi:3-oxoacyl-(acyl-carrier-protein) synthase